MSATKRQQNNHSPYEAALESAFADLEAAQEEVHEKRNELAIAEARARELSQLALRLIEVVTPSDRANHRHRVAALLQSSSGTSRGATVTYANVVQLFAKEPKREWSAPEAHAELVARGIPADAEQVHNVFQYLAKKGRLERVSRGRYIIRVGSGVVGVEGDPEGGIRMSQ
jgi:hypothetical protein